MKSILKENLDLLGVICKLIAEETGFDLIICDADGKIIEATLKQRIGKIHRGARELINGDSDEIVINPGLEQKYLDDGFDTRQGYIYAIRMFGKKVGSLGISGNPEMIKPIVRIAAKTIGLVISKYTKEKEKNRILQKMAKIAEEMAQQPFKKFVYQTFVEDLWHISGAKFVFFVQFNSEPDKSKIVAVAGEKQELDTFTAKLGCEILGMCWQYPVIEKQEGNGISCYNSLQEFAANLLPPEKYKDLIDELDLGQVCTLEIIYKGEILGEFILILKKQEKLNDALLIELYAAQVGQLLVRVKAEEALKKSEAELKDALTVLQYQSTHDALTGIYNRTFFEKSIINLSQNAENYPITTISLDVDGLKVVNDTLGHAKGDELLVNLVKVLKNSIRESDIVARIGGDEFIIMLPKTDKKNSSLIVERINQNVDLFNQTKPQLPLSVSIGMATADNQGTGLQDVIKQADKEMYFNKNLRKQCGLVPSMLNSNHPNFPQ
ncbi:MAG: diguanylate cyclase [Peptococcaceae bacterium]|nr:diguanylate cyclase [Peptococcaceae bacterium]